MRARDHDDPGGLGRGRLTRRLPVLWQASAHPPAVEPFPSTAGTTPSRFLRRVLLSAKRLTMPAAALSVTHQVGEALVPVIAGASIDRALATGDAAQLGLWLLLLAADFLVLSLAFRFAARLTARATELAQHRLRATLSHRVLHPTGGGRGPDGAVVSTMTNDVSRIAAMGLVVFTVGELAGIAFIAASLLLLHPVLGAVVLVGAPVVVWLMGVLSGRYAQASRVYQELLAGTVGRATDLVTGYRVIKGIRAEAEATRRYRDASRRTLAGAYRSVGVLGRFLAGSDIVAGVFIAGVAALAGWFAVTGQLSIGGLIAAVGLAQALLGPMEMITGNAIPLWAGAVASSGRVLDVLHDEAGGGDDGGADAAAEASVSGAVRRVPEVEATIGSAPTVRVSPGELLGIRADDRTAAAVTGALLHPRADGEVEITVDGTPATRLGEAAYRRRVVVAAHHGTLFSGTVADNLSIPGASPGLRDRALHAAGCDDFLPGIGGVHGHIGEMGGRLSGGQRQRLALARALASEAPVLVLHDPTTAVDPVTEARIASRLREARSGRSTILIASSPALLAACDRVIDLGDARAPHTETSTS